MVKIYSQVLTLLFLTVIGFSQGSDTLNDLGFGQNDTLQFIQPLSIEQIEDYVLSQQSGLGKRVIGGQITSIFHEVVDEAFLYLTIEGHQSDSIESEDGLFIIPIPDTTKHKLLDISVVHPDYHQFDTSIVAQGKSSVILTIRMNPKHKILLRGRVYAGNLPIEGADVEITHAGEKHHLKTLGCYYDDEDYWNCLFDGMFKKELIAKDLSDSIKILFISEGMKPLQSNMKFSEYNGEIMRIKMKYAARLPKMPSNNLNLKLAFPLTSSDQDWFVDISYYRALNKTNLKRFAWGFDANMYVSTISVSYPTMPNLEPSTVDSSYITAFIGPSLLFWILSPDRRRFSTYAGCTFSLQLNNPQFVFQPFLGTRYFLDINKALSIEFRYSGYDRDVTYYEFDTNGDAIPYTVSEHFSKFNLNLGIQIVF